VKKAAATIAAAAALTVGGVMLAPGETKPRTGCVRAPLDGGQECKRVGDAFSGGTRYFGAGNVFPVGESNGHASCEPCGCAVLFGDKDTDL
jgi:hypothetical protein